MILYGEYDDYNDDGEVEELRAQARWQRRYNADLSRHPDCRDPDHPGCPRCEPDEFDEEY